MRPCEPSPRLPMKLIRLSFLLLALAATGCVTEVRQGPREGRASRVYRGDLALILTQDVQTADLVFTVKNTSPKAITNFFPETRFEGTVWMIQEGAVPVQAYPSNYFVLLIRALWTNPELVLPPDGTKTYRVPLETLGGPFATQLPDFSRPMLAYGFLNGFETVSNTIQLRHPERVRWESWSVLGPDFSRPASEKPK